MPSSHAERKPFSQFRNFPGSLRCCSPGLICLAPLSSGFCNPPSESPLCSLSLLPLLLSLFFSGADGGNTLSLEPLSFLILLTLREKFHLHCGLFKLSLESPGLHPVAFWDLYQLDYTRRRSMAPETAFSLYFITYSATVTRDSISEISPPLHHHILEVTRNPAHSSSTQVLPYHHCVEAGRHHLCFGSLHRVPISFQVTLGTANGATV